MAGSAPRCFRGQVAKNPNINLRTRKAKRGRVGFHFERCLLRICKIRFAPVVTPPTPKLVPGVDFVHPLQNTRHHSVIPWVYAGNFVCMFVDLFCVSVFCFVLVCLVLQSGLQCCVLLCRFVCLFVCWLLVVVVVPFDVVISLSLSLRLLLLLLWLCC